LEDAQKAMIELDGKPFRGRLLHILPASDKREQKLSDFEISKLPLKKQKEIRRKASASTSSFSWNSLYMNPDAVLASVATRLGVPKSQLLDPASTDAAVKQARAETSVIQETKDHLKAQGINPDAFKDAQRHDSALLLKNFPYGTTENELNGMLAENGTVKRLVFPPSGTIAIVEFVDSYGAQKALKKLAYKNFKGSVLYLEKAPAKIFEAEGLKLNAEADTQPEESTISASGPPATVFIRNLNFATTTARLTELFSPLAGFLSATVKIRTDASRPGELLSMGFGFAEFRTTHLATAAVNAINNHLLDGHRILVQLSTKTLDAAEERRNEDRSKQSDQEKTKVIVKNLPFEASKKDVKSLLGTYGKLRSVRMPKKFDNSARGFAFAEFVTSKEARNAMEALSNTHLLGRRLVLQFAEAEVDDPEESIKAMEKKAGRQSHLTAVSKLITGSARKKFTTDQGQDTI
jgi:multiple RNA-binding domain-containing protein 1